MSVEGSVNLRRAVVTWLAGVCHDLDYFREPLLYAQIGSCVGSSEDSIRSIIGTPGEPIYAVLQHTFKGRKSASKPFALYPCDYEHCILDWEEPLVVALERWFTDRRYLTRRELGSPNDVAALKKGTPITALPIGINQRDLWAHEASQSPQNLWIVEAKGKVAFEFDFYTFAEGMAQIFSYPDQILQGLLGGGNVRARGHVMGIVRELAYSYWTTPGRRIHVALAVPDFRPTPIWKAGKVWLSSDGFFHRPLAALKAFLDTGRTEARTGKYKYQRLFGEMLEHVDEKYGLRSLMKGDGAITFHILTLGTDHKNQQLAVADFPRSESLQL